jgi:hypothetical protein
MSLTYLLLRAQDLLHLLLLSQLDHGIATVFQALAKVDLVEDAAI